MTKKFFTMMLVIIVIIISQQRVSFAQNEATERLWAEERAPKELFKKPLNQEDHPVLLSFIYGGEGMGASISIENPKGWKKMSYGLSITKDAPIGLFFNLKPWTILSSNLYINTGFGSSARVKVDMSNFNATSKTFKDQDNILMFLNLGLTYELGRMEVGAFYKLGQQFPISKKPTSFSWYQGWEFGLGIKL